MNASPEIVPWVVCDFETTGLHPDYHHRVVEIGLVFGTGESIEGEWTTTINPQRDVTASEIHGLRGSDVMGSPTFGQVAGTVLEIFNGRVPVAHNASFDRRFLMSELQRAGITTADAEWFCTLRAMSELGVHPTSLEACCASYGIDLSDAHAALADAKGCAGLIAHEYGSFHPTMAQMTPFAFSGTRTPSAPARPRGATSEIVPRRLSQIALELESENGTNSANADAYLALLIRSLEDRQVSDEEFAALLACANDLGLTGVDVEKIHSSYLAALKSKFLSDGYLNDAEERDLNTVSSLLGMNESQPVEHDPSDAVQLAQQESLAGKSVCFTGELEATIDGFAVSRAHAKRLAEEAGLVVKSGVSKKLDIMVTVDPHSLSAKSRKARELGVRVLAERAFWDAIGANVD